MFHRESPHLPTLQILLALLVLIITMLLLPYPWGFYLIAAGVLLIVLAFLALGLFASYANLRRCLRNRRAPLRYVQVTVERKWTREYDHQLPTRRPNILGPVMNRFFSPTFSVYNEWVFWVSFVSDPEAFELAVPENIYIRLEEGMKGILSVKGDRFVGFQTLPSDETHSENSPIYG